MIFIIGVSIVKCTVILYLTAERSSTLKVIVLRDYLELGESSQHKMNVPHGSYHIYEVFASVL